MASDCPSDKGTAFPHQEIQVRALVGLQHVVEVEPPVAALELGLGRLPLCLSFLQFLTGNDQFNFSLGGVELDDVAVLHQREHAAGGGLGEMCSTTVPYAVPLIRASEMRTMSVTPFFRSFGGSGMLPTSACRGSPSGRSSSAP